MIPPNEGEQVILDEITFRIDTNRNAIVMVVGPPGEGKSYVQLRISELVCSHYDTDMILTFDPWTTLENGARMNRGECLSWDDIGATGSAARDASTVANKVLSYWIESFRYLNTVFLVSVPSVMMADITYRRLCHYVINMRGVDYQEEQSLGLVSRLDTDPVTDEVKLIELTYDDAQGYPVILEGNWYELPDAELREFYEGEKKKALDARWSELLARRPVPKT